MSAPGPNMPGPSIVKTDGFRDTRQVVEPLLNVHNSALAVNRSTVPTEMYGAVRNLVAECLLAETDRGCKEWLERREGLSLRRTAPISRTGEAGRSSDGCGGRKDAGGAQHVLAQTFAGACDWWETPTVGEGVEYRAAPPTGDEGSQLTCEDRLVHGSLVLAA